MCSPEERVGVCRLQPALWCLCSPKPAAGLEDLSTSSQRVMVPHTLWSHVFTHLIKFCELIVIPTPVSRLIHQYNCTNAASPHHTHTVAHLLLLKYICKKVDLWLREELCSVLLVNMSVSYCGVKCTLSIQ